MKAITIDKDVEGQFDATIKALDFRCGAETEKKVEFLYYKFFHIDIKPDTHDILSSLSEVNSEGIATLFFFKDKDLAIKLDGVQPDEIEELSSKMILKYQTIVERTMKFKTFFSHLEVPEDMPALSKIAATKCGKISKSSKDLSQYFENEILINSLKTTVTLVSTQRFCRPKPIVLVVEDQIFAQKMMSKILSEYTVLIASSAAEALLIYVEKCPDIVFLDLELPDVSGHKLSSFIHKIDPTCYVIIVSANKNVYNIKRALQDGVKGFIGKPYDKNRILEYVKNYKREKM